MSLPGRTGAVRWLLLGFVLLGQFAIVASLGSINLALPSIRVEFDTSDSVLQWILVVQQLAYAVVLVIGGRLGDLLGRRRLFLVGIVGFGVASMLAAVAPTAELVLAARLLQGISGGVASPQVLAIIRTTFDEQQRPRAYAAFAMVAGGGFMVGQLAAGLLMNLDWWGLGWRLPFVATAAGTAASAIGVRRAPEGRLEEGSRRLDLVGSGLVALASLLVLFPLIQGQDFGWSWPMWLALAVSVPVAALFIRRQVRLTPFGRALVDVRLFSRRTYRMGLVGASLFSTSAFGPFFVITITLLEGAGLSPFEAALYTAGGPLLMIPASFMSPRVTALIGRLVFVVGGILAGGSALLIGFLLVGVGEGFSPWWLLPILGLQGAGNGLIIPAVVSLTMSEVPAEHAGAASGVYQTAMQFVGAIGLAVYSIVFFGVLGDERPADFDRYASAFAWVLPLMLASAIGVGAMVVLAPTGFLRPPRARRIARVAAGDRVDDPARPT